LDGTLRGVGLEKQIVQRDRCYGFADFPIFVHYTFSDGQADTVVGELFGFRLAAVEAMDDPSLAGLVFFVHLEDHVGSAHVMDDERLAVLFRERDMLLKQDELLRQRVKMDAVDAGLANGGDTVFLKEFFKDFEILPGVVMGIQPPGMDPEGEKPRFRRNRTMGVYVNKWRFHGNLFAKITIFAVKFQV
jgi:hypothetical protein